MQEFKYKINYLLHLARGLALIDGGLVIGIQVMDFLITHFFLQLPSSLKDAESMSFMNPLNIFLVMFGILNLAVIIYRITGIAHGNKHNLVQCYFKGLRSIPAMFILYMLGSIISVSIAVQLHKAFVALLPGTAVNLIVIRALVLALIPYGILVCINVIDKNQNAVQAIISTYKSLRNRISFAILVTLSLMYSVPLCIAMRFTEFLPQHYISLFSTLWVLWCHLVTIAIYIDSSDKEPVSKDGQPKPSKIVII